jgi:tRNA(fMet)-specific endonuclease VapC
MAYLLDTSVYSQPLRRKPIEPSLVRWRDAGDRECRVSVVSVAEVEWGLHLENRESRWQRYSRILESRIQVIEPEHEVWHQFVRMKARQQQLGQIVSDLDLLISAAAKLHHIVVATLNAGDFSRIEGIAWEDWSR